MLRMNSRRLKYVIACVALVSGPLLFAQGKESVARVIVDPTERFQTIEGFGVNFTGPYFRDDQKAMCDMLMDDLGATIFRVVPYLVYSNWEEVNDNDDPNAMNWEYYNNRYSGPIFTKIGSGEIDSKTLNGLEPL